MTINQLEIGSFADPTPLDAPPRQLRVVSWNIARGSGFDLILEFLAQADADLILLQEVDKNCARTQRRNVARELSQELEMAYVSGVEFEELAERSGSSPAYHGQATLCRWELSRPRLLRFARQSNFWRPRTWVPRLAMFQRRLGGRMALVTELVMGRTTAVAYNVHLESRNGHDLRLAQLREVLNEACSNHGGSHAIIGGDFNFDVHSSKVRNVLQEAALEAPLGLRSPTTAPSLISRPTPIDSILHGRAWQAFKAEVHTGVPGSDHYPLSLTLRLQQQCSEPEVEVRARLQF